MGWINFANPTSAELHIDANVLVDEVGELTQTIKFYHTRISESALSVDVKNEAIAVDVNAIVVEGIWVNTFCYAIARRFLAKVVGVVAMHRLIGY